MAIERVSVTTQPRFAALLRYYRHGDFAAFGKAAELAYGSSAASEPYFCANLLFAAQVCGFCEVSNATGATQWWVSHVDDIEIRSMEPKTIGTTVEWFARHSAETQSLVTDGNRAPLVLGSRRSSGNFGRLPGVFDRALSDLVPAFRHIERQLCFEVPFNDEVNGNAEIYNPSSGRWEAIMVDQITESKLFRVRREYSGLAYYVQHSDLGLRFRITQPEWAFVVAYHLLPWRLADILRVEGASVRIHRVVRMPVLICRLLFAAAEALRIGSVVVFENVREPCVAGILRYFETAGDRR